MEGIHLMIKNEGSGFEFSSWVEEKLENTIRKLCYVSHKGFSQDDSNGLYGALSNSILLYAAVTGKNKLFDDKIIQFIFNRGIDAFDCVRYIFLVSTYKGTYLEKRKDSQIIEKLMKHITPDKENRTILHSLIAPIKYKNSWVKALELDLEKVTMNECSWEWFYNKHKNDTSKAKSLLEDDVEEMIVYMMGLT